MPCANAALKEESAIETRPARAPQADNHLIHGAHSENALGPARERHGRELREAYPWIDGRRLALLSDRMARIELASRFVDQRGILRLKKRGELYPVVSALETWASRAEAVLRELEAERRERGAAEPLDELLAEGGKVRRLAEARLGGAA